MPIFIVRHAQTDDNAKRILQVPSSSLSILGHRQAQRLAARLADQPIARIFCSDYVRTQQTADYLPKLNGIEVRLMPQLRERNFGDLRGSAYAQLEIDPFDLNYHPPNGESWAQFEERIVEVWRTITEQYQTLRNDTKDVNFVLITHGLVCRVLAKQFLISDYVRKSSSTGNAALTKVAFSPPWTAQLLNCTAHLNDLASDGSVV